MPLGYILRSYTYWGVLDVPHCNIAKHKENRWSSNSFCFYPSSQSSLCYCCSKVSFSTFLFGQSLSPKCWLYSNNYNWCTSGHPYPPSGFSFLWSIWEKKSWFLSIPKSLSLCAISISPLRPLLSWIMITPTHSHPRRSLNQGDM